MYYLPEGTVAQLPRRAGRRLSSSLDGTQLPQLQDEIRSRESRVLSCVEPAQDTTRLEGRSWRKSVERPVRHLNRKRHFLNYEELYNGDGYYPSGR